MSERLFDDDSGWTDDAWRIFRQVRMAVEVILADEPDVDIRDFHFVASDAVGDVVASTAINRRLEATKDNRND